MATKFIRFRGDRSEVVFINPDQVGAIVPAGDGKCYVHAGGAPVLVLKAAGLVAEELAGERITAGAV